MRLILPLALALALSAPVLAQNKTPPPPQAKVEAPKAEAPKTEAPKAEAPKADGVKNEAPKPEVMKNGDWFVGCQDVTVEGKAIKLCEMQQILEETSSGQAFIRISVVYPRNSGKQFLRILTPLGVMLQKGLQLQIDETKPIVLPFAICVGKPPSCIVEGRMEDSIITAMKRGNGGKLTLSFGNKQTVVAPFSLNGFTKSIETIAPK